jgi:plastocyanin
MGGPQRKAAVLVMTAAALAFLSLPAIASAATTIVVEPEPGEDSFAPSRVTRPLSDSAFRWIWGPNGSGSNDPHDVEQNAGLFDSGPPVTSDDFEVVASAGGFRYFCSIHFEMVGRIDVQPAGGGAYPRPFRVQWARPASETGRRFDVRFKVGGGRWQSWLEETERRSALFGRRERPAEIRNGVPYRFQARALRTGRKRSDWSPALLVGP